MFEVGTVVKIIGPEINQNGFRKSVRDIWWVDGMDKFIGKEYVVDNIINPYDADEGYDGVVYTLSGVNYEFGQWWFVEEWLEPVGDIFDEAEEDIYCDDIMKLI